MRKLLLLSLLFSFSFCVCSQTYTVDTVPNTKLVNNSYISNPDNILNPSTVSVINQKLSALEAKTTTQVAVVVLQSIGEADIFDFAQRLFDKWGIGRAKKDNGLLILLVMDQRTVRFHTGLGLEGVLPDVTCKHIQMERMIPQFKVEDYNAGMIAGVHEVAFILSNPEFADELRDDSRKEASGWNIFFPIAGGLGGVTILIWYVVLYNRRRFSDSEEVLTMSVKKGKNKGLYPEMRIKKAEWIIAFGVVPIALLLGFNFMSLDIDNHLLGFLFVLYVYFVLTLIQKRFRMKKVVDKLVEKKDYYGVTEFFRHYQSFWLFMAILFPLPLLFMFFQYLSRKRLYRNHSRDCKSCSKPLQKLDEKADDQYLEKGQVFEEGLKSVDYDVWLCQACGATEILNYVNRFSKYSDCPKCETRAFFKESDRTIESPTYDSTGSGQLTKACKFCRHKEVSTYSIAKLTRSESSSSSSSGGGGGSSGGSWGGGSSGGGGASSSW